MLKIFGKTMNFKKLVSSRSYIYIKSSKYNLLSTKQVILGYWKVAVFFENYIYGPINKTYKINLYFAISTEQLCNMI